MSLFRMRKPRPFHHEMIYQGRAGSEQKQGALSRRQFTSMREKPRGAVPLEWILLGLLVLLLVFLFYM